MGELLKQVLQSKAFTTGTGFIFILAIIKKYLNIHTDKAITVYEGGSLLIRFLDSLNY